MNYEETVSYLYNQYPDFQNVGKRVYKPGLGNAITLDEYFGSPHKKFKSIHVAGTNGKGSTSHMLAAVLQAAGYKVGLYTSPHLVSFRERIKINGIEIPEQEIVDFVARHNEAIKRIRPSFFELTMSLAFDYFAREAVDVAVVEVGLGGRLDSTNIIHPQVSVITNIAFDHTDLLGDTLEKIAAEKAGIIKPNAPVIVGQRQDETQVVFEQKAREQKAPLLFADRQYTMQRSEVVKGLQHFDVLNSFGKEYAVEVDLLGSYQRKNILTVLAAIELLQKDGTFHITDKNMVAGLRVAAKSTGLRGRWQLLQTHPMVVCDIAHNVDGLTQTMKQLQNQTYRKLHIVFGMVADKDVDGAIALLPKNAEYYFTQATSQRAMSAAVLAKKCEAIGLHGQVTPNVKNALQRAIKNAAGNDFIYVGGSTFIVADALA
ncbi:MAG: bifunctional folylpolyglutamate synthase/dihydrofolate synthase [Prevotellaceae bacterium]|jgi:dihydrofolate synthase/folylpolyglutamate synthase|nr:bifunctional folylpolyglutamate synthase/dihydrofolate synthase [Prevotellaceae bacterium]